MITQITTVVVATTCERRGARQAAVGWTTAFSNGCLVVHDGVHVCPKRVHVLANGDLVFLGLIPLRIK